VFVSTTQRGGATELGSVAEGAAREHKSGTEVDRGPWLADGSSALPLPQPSQLPIRVDTVMVVVAEGEADGVSTNQLSVDDRRPVAELNGRRGGGGVFSTIGTRTCVSQTAA